MSNLPPLASIRAFEVAARHLSFTKAADELCVTQSAVSRHIRHLEDRLGRQLFIRGHRTLLLTPAGEKYADELAGVFRQLGWATDRAARSSNEEQLLIHAYTTFAMYWLVPRLKRFKELYPNIEVQLTAATSEANAEQQQAHAILRVGPGQFENTQPIFPVRLVPVCTPDIRDAYLSDPRDLMQLSRVTLLHSLAVRSNWPSWLRHTGAHNVEPDHGFWFEASAMAYTAAERSLGVALAQFYFIDDQIKRNALVIPFPYSLESERVYCLTWPHRYSKLEPLVRFREWLAGEVEAQRQGLDDSYLIKV